MLKISKNPETQIFYFQIEILVYLQETRCIVDYDLKDVQLKLSGDFHNKYAQ